MTKNEWLNIVGLMRQPVAELGADPKNAWRFELRMLAAHMELASQLRRHLGLGTMELATILALWDGGRMSMTDVGDRIGLSRAAMTTLADHLERIGLIERHPDPSDRRRILIGATLKADKALQAVAPKLADELTSIPAADERSALAESRAAIYQAIREEASSLRQADAPERKRRVRGTEADDLEAGW